MEITVKGHARNQAFSSTSIFEKNGYEKMDKVFENDTKEVMHTSSTVLIETPVKISTKSNFNVKEDATLKNFKREKPPLEEMLAKKYPFHNSDLSDMLDYLLEKDIIKLSEPKRPNEVNKVNSPKYCRYHRMIGHNIEDCITLKELIMKLVDERRILLDDNETIEVNHISITTCTDPPHKPHKAQGHLIQFGSLPSTKVWIQKQSTFPKQTIKSPYALPQYTNKADSNKSLITAAQKRSRKQMRLLPQAINKKQIRWGKKNPRHAKIKKRSKWVVKSSIHTINHLKQNPPSPREAAKAFNAQVHVIKKNDCFSKWPGAIAWCEVKK